MLGPLEVRCDGTPITVPGGKSSELLVRLALEAGDLVRTDRLVEDVWAGDVATRRNTVQSKVTRLRRALGDPSAIVGNADGYRLAVDEDQVDAFVVRRDAAVAARLLGTGELRSAADTSESALARFAGDVLPSAGDAEWAIPNRVRLEETRTQLTETYFAARLGLGDSDDLVAGLEAAVAAFPYHESLWQLLITALYRSGRQADALAAYQRVRASLATELGLEPGPSLRQVEQQILLHDSSLGVDARPGPGLLRARAGNLPSMSVDLVGRARDVEAVLALMEHGRLVEVVGAGGVGKTALAIAAARVWSARDADTNGGVWLARLEAAATADEVTDVLLAALNVAGGEAALYEWIRPTTGLLILDNCEHVVEAAAGLAQRLLDAAPGLRILCTSQMPLDVDGEARYELAPLALPDAIELFTRRAAAQRTPPGPSNDESVHELCQSLDGLPLAIELAAARTRTLPIDEITRRLDDRFAVLVDPASRKPERRRALKATIGWSYELLFPDDKRGLWHWRRSRVARPCPRWSSSSAPGSTCRRPRRSTSWEGSPAVRSWSSTTRTPR